MNRVAVAQELVKIAKELVAAKPISDYIQGEGDEGKVLVKKFLDELDRMMIAALRREFPGTWTKEAPGGITLYSGEVKKGRWWASYDYMFSSPRSALFAFEYFSDEQWLGRPRKKGVHFSDDKDSLEDIVKSFIEWIHENQKG